MTVFGLILLGVGVILFFVQRRQHAKAFLIGSAEPVEAGALQKLASQIAGEIGGGNWRDYVRVRGIVRAEEPLLSELSQKPCVHYSMSVRREYEESVTTRNSSGSRSSSTRRGSETVADNKRSIPFHLEDQTGRVLVDLDGASIETVEVLDEFKPEPTAGGSIVFGGFQMNLPSLGGGRRTLGYRYRESILPINESVLVVGAVSDSTGELRLCRSADGAKKLIVTTKAYDALAAGAVRKARVLRYVMIAFVVAGMVMATLGIVR